ncbi:MAG TPA: hypothetical protein VG347_13500 [Verrucomicrobiae bacterium]|nr:hypothetical protein [Verrucomicrobiae bacterium]
MKMAARPGESTCFDRNQGGLTRQTKILRRPGKITGSADNRAKTAATLTELRRFSTQIITLKPLINNTLHQKRETCNRVGLPTSFNLRSFNCRKQQT